MSLLKLDDFLNDDLEVELKGETFKLNISFKAFLKYLKWDERVRTLKQEEYVGEDIEFLKIIFYENESARFIELFEQLSANNQTAVLTQLIRVWSENALPQHLIDSNDKSQKKK